MNAIEISKAKMPALVAFYNETSGKKAVTKFADIATARKRCLALLPKEAKDPKAAKPKAEKTKAEKTAADRSAAIAASWLRPEVAAKRIERTGVKVGGEIYGSVRKAFVALGLSLGTHIRFRMALKASESGSAVYEDAASGKKIKFTIVDVAAE